MSNKKEEKKVSKKEMSDYINYLLCTQGIDFTKMSYKDLKELARILMDLNDLVKKRITSEVKSKLRDTAREFPTLVKIAEWIADRR